jgi:hypothetical protein
VRTCEPLRATLDIAAWHPERLDRVMAELVGAGCYTIGAVHGMLGRERRQGRPGVSALERALARWANCAEPALV